MTATTCPRCHAPLTPGDRFCADCGARVAAADPPPTEGRAQSFGPGLAGQTDPGLRHATNQDAFALSGPPGGGPGTILVLCDGVSNSQTPERAAATAAQVAHDFLQAIFPADPEQAMAEAIRAAHDAVCALPFDRQATLDPPATTIVAAIMDEDGATIGWLGDSRAYALAGPGARLLTRDHSWFAAATEQGVSEAEARRDPRAHALLHCLGTTDFSRPSPCPTPGTLRLSTPDARWLLLCSDGLWNDAETAAALASAAAGGLDAEAPDLCARLVAYARHTGGHDNITVLAARWPPPG